jgi:hypothetical protein
LQVLRQRGDPLIALRQAVEPGVDDQVLPHRQAMRQVNIGRGKIHPRQHAVAVAQHVLVKDAHRTGGRQQQAQQDRQGRGLAGAIAAQQRRRDAALDRKADAVHGRRRAIALDQIFDKDDGLGHRPYMAEDFAGGQHSGRTAAMLLRSAIVPVSNFSLIRRHSGKGRVPRLQLQSQPMGVPAFPTDQVRELKAHGTTNGWR